MYKVEGKSHLIKDPTTGSVSNTDMKALKEAKRAKQKFLEEQRQKEDLLNRVERLEKLIERMTNNG